MVPFTLFLKFPRSYGVICSGASAYQRLSIRSPGSSLEKKGPKHSGLIVDELREEAKSWISAGVGQHSWSGWQYLVSQDDRGRRKQVKNTRNVSNCIISIFWFNTMQNSKIWLIWLLFYVSYHFRRIGSLEIVWTYWVREFT